VTRYWVAVASREHVLAAVSGSFCQLNHGKEAPVRRLSPGDRILYYSPREGMRAGEVVQAFTAAGEVLEGEPYQVEWSHSFRPFRRRARYLETGEARISPLLSQLSFTRGRAAWGQVLRRGAFEVEPADYVAVTAAMRPPASDIRDVDC